MYESMGNTMLAIYCNMFNTDNVRSRSEDLPAKLKAEKIDSRAKIHQRPVLTRVSMMLRNSGCD
jgi:hypothetical protein